MRVGKCLAAGMLVVVFSAGVDHPVFADQYRVAFSQARGDDDGALRLASVEAWITPREGEIGFFRAGSDTGLYHQWATFLLGIHAQASDGKPLELRYRPHGVWAVSGWLDGEIKIRYQMLLQHDRFPNEPGDDELAAARPYGVFWTTRALLLEGGPADNISVAFDLPDDWRVTTPWARRGDGWTFFPKNSDDLLDAGILVGRHEETVLAIGDGEARLALAPPLAEAKGLLAPLLQAYLGQFAEMFGQSPADAILLIALDASFLGGGVIGRTISLSIPPSADMNAALPIAAYIVAHEGFHLWNGRWQSDPQHGGELEWLAEGTAEYYALLTALRLGHIDQSVFLAQLSERYAKYLNALRSGQTLVSAASSKLSSPDSYDLLYSGGMLATLLLDLDLRAGSDGNLSADDLMYLLQRRYSRAGGPALSLDALSGLLASEFGYDFAPVVRGNLRDAEPLPLTNALDSVGLRASIEETDGMLQITIDRAQAPSDRQQRTWAQWTESN